MWELKGARPFSLFMWELEGARSFPLFMGEGDEQIQIGTAFVTDETSTGLRKILAHIDVFAGERLSFSRIVHWVDTVTYSQHKYPKG